MHGDCPQTDLYDGKLALDPSSVCFLTGRAVGSQKRTIVTISPNPSQDSPHFTIYAMTPGTYKLSIVDLQGHIVWSQAFSYEQGTTNTYELTVPSGILSAGVYQAILYTASGVEIAPLSIVR